MKHSIVNYRNLEKTSRRLDSEYYHPNNLKFINILKSIPHIQIGAFCIVTDGIHTSIDFDDKSKINLISAKSPKENYFDLSSTGFISKLQHEKNPRTKLRKDDIIISSVGTIGNCAVVDEDLLPANSDRHVGIIRIQNKIKPRFLSSFLLSKYGRFQSFRESTGNVQLNLFIYKIKEIIIPAFSDKFQNQIENICKKSHRLLQVSKSIYFKAEKELLRELGLENWKPKSILNYEKSFLDVKKASRIDAEYYQPMYERIEKKIKEYSNGWDNLESLTIIKKGVEPGGKTYQEKGIPFIRVSNLKKFGLANNNQQYLSKIVCWIQVSSATVII